jgi:hypothetical protein
LKHHRGDAAAIGFECPPLQREHVLTVDVNPAADTGGALRMQLQQRAQSDALAGA